MDFQWRTTNANVHLSHAGGVEVYDKSTGEYVRKTSHGGGLYKFFPDSWDAEKIVAIAQNVRKDRNHIKKGSDYCLKDVRIEGCEGPKIDVQIYTDGPSDNAKITSAFLLVAIMMSDQKLFMIVASMTNKSSNHIDAM